MSIEKAVFRLCGERSDEAISSDNSRDYLAVARNDFNNAFSALAYFG